MLVITRPVGIFSFELGTPVTLAKQICDAIQGRILTPENHDPPITNSQECYDFVMTQCGNVLNAIPFRVELR